MIESRMRSLEFNGQRMGIRLDVSTWKAIDWIAVEQNRKWAAWARERLEKHPDADNMTAVIREEAMKQIFAELMKVKEENKSALTKKELIGEFRKLLEELAEV